MNPVGWVGSTHFQSLQDQNLAGQTTAQRPAAGNTVYPLPIRTVFYLCIAKTGRDRLSHELNRRDRSISCAPMIVCTFKPSHPREGTRIASFCNVEPRFSLKLPCELSGHPGRNLPRKVSHGYGQ